MPNESLLNLWVWARGLLKKDICCGVADTKSFDSEDILNLILLLEEDLIWNNFAFEGSVDIWELNDGLWEIIIGLIRLFVFTISLVVIIKFLCFSGLFVVYLIKFELAFLKVVPLFIYDFGEVKKSLW